MAVMGRVKDFYHDEICARASDELEGPEPDELEMLAIDAEQARERYLAALAKHKKGNEHDKSF